MVSRSSKKTKEDFENVLLNKETPYNEINYWINRLEKELGIKD